MLFLVALMAAGGVAFYVMTPEERLRVLRRAIDGLQPLASAATPRADERAFHEALRARTSTAIVTPAIVLLNLGLFVGMLFGAGRLSDPATLVAWGANYAPRTTNGEWWRLVASIFVHAGFIELVLNIIGLVVIGHVLERLVGKVTFVVVYIAAGLAGSLASLFADPLATSAGATAAVLGIYGLLVATLLWSLLRRSPLTMPLAVAKRLGPVAALFVFYVLVTGRISQVGNITGLAVGLGLGLVLTRNIGERTPSFGRAAAAMGVTVAIAAICSVPLRGIADIGPSIAQVVAAEDRTTNAYQHAVNQFVKGRANAAELATLIEKTILPDLQVAGAPLRTLGKVAHEQQTLVADASEYLRLRTESWQLRADGLRARDMHALREADKTERSALTALDRVRPAGESSHSETPIRNP
jgi:membrane associated rhomboid family serine protease